MTAKNSDSALLYRPRTAGFSHRLAIGAVLSAAAFLCVAASAQTAPSSEPAPTTASASTPANPDQRPDSAIAEDINTKLMASNTLRPLNLGIWVHNGTATLTGAVPTQELRTEAETMVKSVAGVTNVDDKITIGPSPPPRQDSPARIVKARTGKLQAPFIQVTRRAHPHPLLPSKGRTTNEPPPPAENYGNHQAPGMVTVAPGTPAYVMVMQPIDSKHTKVGTPFRGILVQDIVVQNGLIAIPRGADISGTVVDARGPGKLKGKPHLALQLTGLNFSGTTYPLVSQVWARGGPGKGGQSAANIGGSAAAGAIIGGAVGGGPTALLGGLLGGLGGAGLSSLSSGPQLYIPPESVLTFYLNAPVTVHVPTYGEIQQLASRVPPSAYGHPAYGRGYPPPPGYYPPPQPVYYPPPGAPPGGYPY